MSRLVMTRRFNDAAIYCFFSIIMSPPVIDKCRRRLLINVGLEASFVFFVRELLFDACLVGWPLLSVVGSGFGLF